MLSTHPDLDRVIEMAWEDKTPFEAIKFQFQLSESQVIDLMRKNLKPSSFKLWRKRVHTKVSKKHLATRSFGMVKFKSPHQRHISGNKISKR
jgi:uncharacterized protein (TIGR03643 family)